jgi:mRNA interferase RelE/StbE
VIYEVDWEPAAIDLASRYLMDDPEGLRLVSAAVDSLAEDPRHDRAFLLGATGMLRLRAGRYRVVYQIDDATPTVSVMHVGRRACPATAPPLRRRRPRQLLRRP